MADITIQGSALGSSLQQLLMCDEIDPGAEPSYQVCKTIYLYHPLGAKMAENPVAMAQSQQRDISIPKSPEDRVREAFEREWKAIGADRHIFNVMRLARVYGIASVVMGADGMPTDKPIDPLKLPEAALFFNVLDPLNTAGSLVLNQDPNAADFQKHTAVTASGAVYHRSRCCVILNEDPIYISYTTSAFGFVGRSVYQRALFPLKTFVQTMIADDMVSKKVGLLVAKMKQGGSIADGLMAKVAGIKRNLLKEAGTGNVISIGHEEDVASLDLKNLEGPLALSRKHALENVAAAASMPAILLNNETFAEGFGEGIEDAKAVARYVDGVRVQMAPLYEFFDRIVQARAWNAAFYETIQADFPDYKAVDYKRAFYEWTNSFTAEWPSLLVEPDSEKVKVEDVKFKAMIALLEVLLPTLDPENKATAIQWAQDNFNEQKLLFTNPLTLDFDARREYVPPAPVVASEEAADESEPKAPRPFGGDA